jgi:hypothetical protein
MTRGPSLAPAARPGSLRCALSACRNGKPPLTWRRPTRSRMDGRDQPVAPNFPIERSPIILLFPLHTFLVKIHLGESSSVLREQFP